ncbi:hypothetical protein [Kitasatospora camelliae]|uniref:Leucine rich repeat (LRR) protein n=1 Tax=Kitasatospora camelliae TaxID=3156397 RepID=A0AAU8JRL1_9ACTN
MTADPLPHVSSPYACFRASAAAGDGLPPEVVERLLAAEECAVRTAMVLRAPEQLDPATAERIDRDHGPPKQVRWRPADAFAFPPESLRRFAVDPDARMRLLAPRDPGLPAGLAERLAADPAPEVRMAVAPHPNLPVESVARAAAGSPALPVDQMRRILELAGL